MKKFLILAILTQFSCDLAYTNWPYFPEDIPHTPRIQIGEESHVLANLFTLEDAVEARVWISPAGVWTFLDVEYLFDDKLANVTPDGPELRFHALGEDAVNLPLPPGIQVTDFPEFQVELGGDEDLPIFGPAAARFVPSGDSKILAIRHTTAEGDRLLRLLPGAVSWTEERLPSGLGAMPIRTLGPHIALLEHDSQRAQILQNGELREASTLLAAFSVPTESSYWLGPFDGSALRMFWSEQPEILCTGVVNTQSLQGSVDGCMNFGTPHAGVVQASGNVFDTAATVYEMDFSNNTRTVMMRAQQGSFELLGMGGYSGYRSWTPASVFAAHPSRPNITESDCDLDADLYSVSRFFETDGTFGFNRCPVSMPTDICECSRSSDPKKCACSARMVEPQWMLRTGSYTHTLVGWEKVDSRLILRTYGHETDRQNQSTLDPKDELQEHPGIFSFDVQISIEALAPGYQTPLSEMTNLTHCSDLVGPNGPVARNANNTFTVDTRESYTVTLDCTPNDGGPPLERFVASFDWSLVTGPGFRFMDVLFARGMGVDFPLNATVSVHPSEASMVASSGTSHVGIALMNGALSVQPLPAAQGMPTFLAFGQARFEDGQVVDLSSGDMLGNLPSGRLMSELHLWLGDNRSIWRLAPMQAPTLLASAAGNVLAASEAGDYVATDSQGVWAYDADGFPAQLYATPGRVVRAGMSVDGKYVAIEASRLGTANPFVRLFTRDESAVELAYVETFVCEDCAMMRLVPTTAELIYVAQQGGVESYKPQTGATSVLNTGFVKSVPGTTGLVQDYYGRVWWVVNQDLVGYDPSTGAILTHALDIPGGTLSNATFHILHNRFEGYSRSAQVYGIDETGVSVVYQSQTDSSRNVFPLAGNRGYQQGYFGERNADSTDILNAIEMTRAIRQPMWIPRERNLPCVLIQQAPFPDYITSTHTNYVCAR